MTSGADPGGGGGSSRGADPLFGSQQWRSEGGGAGGGMAPGRKPWKGRRPSL